MTYDIIKNDLSVYEKNLNSCKEIPIDIDFSLPDYCPDIQKILKCKVTPNITSRNISSDRLVVEGYAQVNLLYADSESNKLYCAENSVSFSCNFEVKDLTDNYIIYTSACVEYMNCRAISPRKVDIHGAINMCTSISEKSSLNTTCDINGNDMEKKTKSTTASKLVGIGQQQFLIEETLELPESQNPPQSILYSDAKMILNEYKILPNKVVIKGKAFVNVLYSNDINSNSTEKAEYEIPINQIIDVQGVSENCTCTITPEILSYSTSISNQSDNFNAISCEIKASAGITAFENENIDIICDVYSTKYNTEYQKESIELLKLEDIINENFTHTETITTSQSNIKSITDIFTDICSVQTTTNDNKINFKGKINIGILAISDDDTPIYIERVSEFDHSKTIDSPFNQILSQASAVSTSSGYSNIKDNNFNIKTNINLYAPIYSLQNHEMISNVTTNEAEKENNNSDTPLIIYYAKQGEKIWDIARDHRASVDSITSENNLQEDTVPSDQMILIPSKQI